MLEEHAGDGETLLLAAGEEGAEFADGGVVAAWDETTGSAVHSNHQREKEGGAAAAPERPDVPLRPRNNRIMHPRLPRRLHYHWARLLTLTLTLPLPHQRQIPIPDIEPDAPVEQRRILGHDRHAAPQARQRHPVDALPIDADGSLLRVVEAVQQLEDGGLAAAAGADDGGAGARGEGEAAVPQDRARGVVPEGDVVEDDGGGGAVEWPGVLHDGVSGWLRRWWRREGRGSERGRAGELPDVDVHLLQVEERLHVEQALAQFAVDAAEEVEGYAQLEDELVDHDEVADGEGAGGDARRREVHHACQGGGKDYVLTRVEGREGGGDADGGGFVGAEGGVVAREFVGLVVEVLREGLSAGCLKMDEC